MEIVSSQFMSAPGQNRATEIYEFEFSTIDYLQRWQPLDQAYLLFSAVQHSKTIQLQHFA